MTLRLIDTLSGLQRDLVPLEPGHVRIYSCGPTVYGPAHIGNFRSFLFADLFVRYLRYRGLRVTWVMNITDIDDKIIRGAAAKGISIGELARTWADRFVQDAAALRMSPPDVQPRATDHIPEMASLISTLSSAATPTRPATARSSSGSPRGRHTAAWPVSIPTQLRVGERVEADEYAKDDIRDFAVWKGPKAGEPSFETAIGAAGRAGTSSARR